MVVTSRGHQVAVLERVLELSGDYVWQRREAGESPKIEVPTFLAQRARFDEDFWALELDIADPERFIAETIASG